MKLFMLLIGKDVLEQMRDIRRNSLFIILPIAIFLCLYAYFQVNDIELNFIKPIEVGVVVEDETVYSQMLVNDFESKKELSEFFVLTQGKYNELKPKFDNKDLDALIIIPKDFVRSLMYFEYKPMDILIYNEDPIKTMVMYNAFIGYERYILSVEKGVTAFYNVFRNQVEKDDYWEYNDALSVELIMTMINRNQMYEFEPIMNIPPSISGDYYYISISVMFIFLLSLFVSINMISERKNQAFLRLNTTRVSVIHYLMAKTASNWIIVFSAYLIWSSFYAIFTNQITMLFNMELILLIIIATLTSVVVAMLVTVITHNESDMILISSVFVFFSGILGGSIIPIHYMPEGLKLLSEFTPNYVLIRSMLFAFRGFHYDEYWLLVALMLSIGTTSFVIMIYRYRLLVGRGEYA